MREQAEMPRDLTCVPQSLYCLKQIVIKQSLAPLNMPVLFYTILLKALLIVLNGRVGLYFICNSG